MKIKIIDGTSFQFLWNGNSLVNYDMNTNKINNHFYPSDNTETGGIELALIIDKTSLEIFVDKGAFTVVESLPDAKNQAGLQFDARWNPIEIKYLEVLTKIKRISKTDKGIVKI